jgi:hypothetical protein
VTLTRPTSIAGHARYRGAFTVRLRLTNYTRRGVSAPLSEVGRRVMMVLIGPRFTQGAVEVTVDQQDEAQLILTVKVWPSALPADPVVIADQVRDTLSAAADRNETIRLLDVSPPPLRFRVTKAADPRPDFANWYVVGSEDDWSGDPIWGHFTTWQGAMDYACLTLTNRR